MGGGTGFNTHRHTLLRLVDTTSGTTLDVVADPATFGIGLVSGLDEAFDSGRTFWLRGSPVLLGLVTSGGDVELHFSVGGAPVRTISLDGAGVTFDRVELGHAPMLWAQIDGVPSALTSAKVVEKLESLGPFDLCTADFNSDGALNILDFIAFQIAFLAQDPQADCTGDDLLNVLDFICFQNLFKLGCP
jgi:hypothetical protein